MVDVNNNKLNDLNPLYIDNKHWDLLINTGYPKIFGAGETLLYQDQPNTGMICMLKGKIKTCITFDSGAEKIFGIFDAPALLGEAATFDGRANVCNAIALIKVEAICIPPLKLKALVMQHPEITQTIIRSIANKLRSIANQVESLSGYNIEQRIARMLCNFKEYGFFVNSCCTDCLQLTHEELAGFVGASRPNVTASLGELAHLGLIEMQRGKIRIIDYARLKQMSELKR